MRGFAGSADPDSTRNSNPKRHCRELIDDLPAKDNRGSA